MRPMPGLRVSDPAHGLHASIMPGAAISHWVVVWVVQRAESIIGLSERQNSTYTLARDAYPSCVVVWGASDELMTAIQAALPAAWLSR